MKNVFIETYGCRMNLIDSEIILSILSDQGYTYTPIIKDADIVLINTCSVRKKGNIVAIAEIERWEKILPADVIIGIVGCMAKQIEPSFFKQHPRVQVIANPESYRLLPTALNKILIRNKKYVLLNNNDNSEAYDDILPKRVLEDKVTAAVTIMKGCDLFCSYCIEPYTRGKRVNRSYNKIMAEVANIASNGYKELTLFGHIVDLWQGVRGGLRIGFAQLLGDIAEKFPSLRIKYISSHVLTFSDEIIDTIVSHPNIMRVLHLPVESGSDDVLLKMNRSYNADFFVKRIKAIRQKLPDINIITDIMVGFPGETEADFNATLKLIRTLQFGDANVFAFSMREGTKAYYQFADDISPDTKEKRKRIATETLNTIIYQNKIKLIGTLQKVVIESGPDNNGYCQSRDMYHRNVLIKDAINIGKEVIVRIKSVNGKNLLGEVI